MLKQNGFDLWADDYDKSVGLSDEDGTYPFAGYKKVLNAIYNEVLSRGAKTVLDIGFGTGTLTAKLYDRGCRIYGQDFSRRMLTLAKEKMPLSQLYCEDFSLGLVPELKENSYDVIIATYSLHHLSDEQKMRFLHSVFPLLNKDGCLCIGDVAFETREDLENCRAQAGDDWDEDEIYFVYDELREAFPGLIFQKFSHCAGVLYLQKSQ